MKKTLLLSIALVLVGFNSSAQWELQNPLPTGNNLYSVFFTNTNTGYAVGDLGTILKTIDSGTTWIAQSSGTSYALKSVYFSDIETGFVVGDAGTILKTVDGGEIWDSLNSGTTNPLNSVGFFNANVGYAVGDGILLKTSNGGETWIGLPIPGGSGLPFNWGPGYFTDANIGYAVRNESTFGFHGIISKTVNGGTNWTDSDLQFYCPPLASIYFSDVNTGYAVGGHPGIAGTILKTNNAGSTWDTVSSGVTNILKSVCFKNSYTGYIVGENGTILKTADAGNTWTFQTSGTFYYLNSVYFTDTDNGCAVGDGGIILKTSDGGTTWTSQSSNVTTSTLTSVYFSNDNNGHAVGWNDGPPVNTTNAGVPWTASTIEGSFNSAFFTDANTGFAVGTNCREVQCWGVIDKTTDGGITWTDVYYGSMWLSFNSVFFTDINTGYVVGGDVTNVYTNGTILKTINGGTDWTIVSAGSIHTLTSVYFTDANNGIAVGYGGTILKTNDGGTTWSDESVITNYDLYSVYFTGVSTGYAVGYFVNPGWPGYGIILNTTDGGITWTSTESGPFALLSICFPDANTGYVVGQNGHIVKTIDAGTTWITQASGTTNNLHSVFFNDDNTGYAVGDNGTILKTSDGGTVGISEKPVVSRQSSVVSYPNPFSSFTTFEYTIEESGLVTLEIFNQTGQMVAGLVNDQQMAGTRQVTWNAEGMPAGIYYYTLRSGKHADSGKIIIMK